VAISITNSVCPCADIYMNGRGLSQISFVGFVLLKSIGFAAIVKAEVCASTGQPENKLSTCAVLPALV